MLEVKARFLNVQLKTTEVTSVNLAPTKHDLALWLHAQSNALAQEDTSLHVVLPS